MKTRILNIILIIAAVVLIRVATIQPKEQEAKITTSTTVVDENILHFFPEAKRLVTIDTIWLEVFDGDKNLLGYAVYSSPYTDKVYGFSGNTPLLIIIDTIGKIKGTKILRNSESKDFLSRTIEKGLFDQWTGLSVSEALDKTPDVVSGATYTSNGVINTFVKRMSILENTTITRKIDYLAVLKDVLTIFVLLFALYAFFYPKKVKKYRLYLLSLSVIILGFWQGLFLSMESLHGWIVNGFVFQTQWLLLIILVLAVVLPLVTKRHFYCTWLCPFGAAQELMGKIPVRKIKLSSKFVSILGQMRKYILLVIIFLLVINFIDDLTFIEPFAAFKFKVASMITLILAGIFLLLSMFIAKPWCRFFCPTGQTLETVRNI